MLPANIKTYSAVRPQIRSTPEKNLFFNFFKLSFIEGQPLIIRPEFSLNDNQDHPYWEKNTKLEKQLQRNDISLTINHGFEIVGHSIFGHTEVVFTRYS